MSSSAQAAAESAMAAAEETARALEAETNREGATEATLLRAKEEYVLAKRHYMDQYTAVFFAENLAPKPTPTGAKRAPLAALADGGNIEGMRAAKQAALDDGRSFKARAAATRRAIVSTARRTDASAKEVSTLKAELAEALAELSREQALLEAVPERTPPTPSAGRMVSTSAEAEATLASVGESLRKAQAEHARASADCEAMEAMEAAEVARLAALRSAAEERRRDATSGAQQVAKMSDFYDGALALGQVVGGIKVLEATASLLRFELATSPAPHTLSIVLAPRAAAELSTTAPPSEESAELVSPELALSRAVWAQSAAVSADLTPATIAVAPLVDAVLDRLSGPAAVSAIVHGVAARLSARARTPDSFC
ncbi:hypothetical protein FNF29_05957 [Cafeteria roenbergensis]|uniref:Uncharacterized protein n=3 Tax=Cafeteria roenbergensis TaxID=33653 RepID=A0A5A8CAA4_CAFRO|nr:hypothetical protein FNF29_05957 [Cafeteria roenbergensis]KAA0166082.1 hypothetical protein FNF28_03250 [Cafeteria roenbergensis]KAA0167151.1 hypothetical protein FNF31_01037 [Cafeteria roenbergensis]|eukprot:KAA0149404.1 hypothetical protein FNF29_05957 [Cafeteria roenbergensis]